MVNYLAVLVAGIASMAVGFLWYGVFFDKTWMKLMELKESDLKKAKEKGMAKSYILSFISSLVTAYVMSFAIAAGIGITGAGLIAFWAWLGFQVPVLMDKVLWEQRPWSLFFLSASGALVHLLVIGLIVGLWR